MKNHWCELSVTSMSEDLSKEGENESRKVEDQIGECVSCFKLNCNTQNPCLARRNTPNTTSLPNPISQRIQKPSPEVPPA